MDHPEPGRDPLERLAEEFTHRLRCGEQPSVEQWAASHPDLSEQIRATFPGLAMMEELASREFSARQTTAEGTTALATLQIERIGDFRIVRQVGRGGMGIVYEAVQESLGRRVAFKVLPAPKRAGVSGLARFERKAAAAARLHHTNIVPVFAVGSEEDVCFYAMQFIDGEPLDRILQQTEPARLREPDYARWVARVGLQVAQGLEYAHTRGTLHRDIKPANLLIDEQQTAWITDFGVAQLAESEDLTIPGDVVGTLRYMSPEQINGQADARSDVYSLGLTLYEMLTLRPAFGESSPTRLLRQISEAEPASLPKSNPAAPLDLVTIVSKAMAREPERRYPSASELAEGLERFLRGEPIRARRVTAAERAWRWCRRNRSLAESHANLASVLLKLERTEDGLAHDRAALDILDRMVQNKPADPLCRQKLAETLVLAVGYGRTPLSVEDTRSRLDKSRQIAEQLIEERPDYPEYQVLLAKTQVRQAAVLGSIGDRKGANGLLDQCITLLEDLAERYPRSPQFAFLLATTLIATSGATGSAEELEFSRGRLERAILILEKLSKEYPTAARWAKPYLARAEQRLRRAKQSRDREQAGMRKNPTSGPRLAG